MIFEVEPAEGKRSRYLDLAASLRSELDTFDGFISVERFQSLSDENRILSLSFFEDEAALARWRSMHMHRQAQSEGRSDVFKDYRLRIAEVRRDYGMRNRAEAPSDSRHFHD